MRFLSLCILSSALVAESASAGITFAASVGQPNWQPSHVNESSSYQHYEITDSGGTPTDPYDCPPTFTCFPTIPPGGHYTVQLMLDGQREEIVNSVCNGVAGFATSCVDKALLTTLRVKVGPLKLTSRGSDNDYPLLPNNGTGRFHWGADKYWQGEIGAYTNFPVGQYTIEVLTNPPHECNPTPVNSAMTVTVTEGGVGVDPADFLWQGHACEWYFYNNSADYGGTITSSDGQSCPMPPNGECYLDLPFGYDQVIRMSGYGDGTKPHYRYPVSSCSSATSSDHTICDIGIRREGSVNVDFEAVEAGPPVLTATAGPATPVTKSADKAAENVVVQQVHLAPTTGQPSVTALSLTSTGGHPDVDFNAVKVIKDVNSNGIFDGTDTILGSGTFGGDGHVTITLDSALVVASGTDVAIAVDVNSELAARVDLPGSPWSLLLVILIPVFVLARRHRAAAVLALCLVVVACGGGNGGTDDTDNDQHQADDDHNGDDDNNGDTDLPINSVVFTFAVSDATVATGTVSGFPLTGGSLTVAR
jgi:hypothetical protein